MRKSYPTPTVTVYQLMTQADKKKTKLLPGDEIHFNVDTKLLSFTRKGAYLVFGTNDTEYRDDKMLCSPDMYPDLAIPLICAVTGLRATPRDGTRSCDMHWVLS